jgi:hypothetical protein
MNNSLTREREFPTRDLVEGRRQRSRDRECTFPGCVAQIAI